MSSKFHQQNVIRTENEWAIKSLTILRAVLMSAAFILICTALKHGKGLSFISSISTQPMGQVQTSSL